MSRSLHFEELGEIATYLNGKPFKPSEWSDMGIPILRIQNLTGQAYEQNYYSGNDLPSKYLCKDGDILISWSGSLGIYEWKGDTAAVNQHIFKVVFDKKKVDKRYFVHAVTSVLGEMGKNTHGSTMKHITKPDFDATKIFFPPLPEQRRIAAILDTADLIRQKRKAAIAKLDELAQSVFYEMFGDPIIGNTGLPIHPLGKLCDVRDGTHDSPKYIEENGFPLVTSKNLSSGFLDLSSVNLISKSDFDSINKRSKVDRGDIIMPMIGTIGSPVLIEEEPLFAIKNVALIKFQSDSPLPKYIRHILSYDYFEHVVKQINKGGTQKFISLGDIRSFPIPVANKPQQEEFVHKVDAIGVLRESHQLALSREESLFSSLQHRAFAGEL